MPLRRLDALLAVKVASGSSNDLIDVIELLQLRRVSPGDVSRRLSGEELDRFQVLVRIATLEKKGQLKEARRLLIAMLGKSVGSARRA